MDKNYEGQKLSGNLIIHGCFVVGKREFGCAFNIGHRQTALWGLLFPICVSYSVDLVYSHTLQEKSKTSLSVPT